MENSNLIKTFLEDWDNPDASIFITKKELENFLIDFVRDYEQKKHIRKPIKKLDR